MDGAPAVIEGIAVGRSRNVVRIAGFRLQALNADLDLPGCLFDLGQPPVYIAQGHADPTVHNGQNVVPVVVDDVEVVAHDELSDQHFRIDAVSI